MAPDGQVSSTLDGHVKRHEPSAHLDVPDEQVTWVGHSDDDSTHSPPPHLTGALLGQAVVEGHSAVE